MNEVLRLTLIFAGPLLAVAAWWRIGRPRGLLMDLMAFEAALVVVVEVAGAVTKHQGINNSALYNTFMLLEQILVLAMVIAHRPTARVLPVCLAVADVAVWAGTAGLGTDVNTLSVERFMAFGVVQALALLVVLWQLAQRSDRMLHHVPAFWLFLGLLLYFSALAPVLGIIRWVAEADRALARQIWAILPFIILLRYLLAAWAAVLAGRDSRSAPHGTQ